MPQRSHDTDTDILKILAALFVVMIHSCAELPGHLFFNALSRFSVPVFVLISGHYCLYYQSPPAFQFYQVPKVVSADAGLVGPVLPL